MGPRRVVVFFLAIVMAVPAACSFGGTSPKPRGANVDVNAQVQRVIAKIPDRPAYPSAQKVLDRLNAAGVACAGSVRRPHDDTLECYLPGGENLVASVFATTRDRDDLLRRRLRQSWLPQTCVFGANWFVTLDADSEAERVARALGGIVVRIGSPGPA
ncbi:MAG TPA: hypothetical protein VF069_02040 [Streptosporangiaceae bacterium]